MGKYVNCMNERGFTMIDALYGFTIFLLIMCLVPISINHITQSADPEKTINNLEWTVFLQLLKKEVRMSEGLTAADKKLIVLKNSQNITYEVYGTNIRRRVNDAGHEIVLQNVEHVAFEEKGRSITLSVIDLTKEEQNAVLTPFTLGSAEND